MYGCIYSISDRLGILGDVSLGFPGRYHPALQFGSGPVSLRGIRTGPGVVYPFTTAGNALGGVTCYWIGRMGKTEWIEKYFKVDKKQMDRAIRFIHGRGSWMAFFSFLPVIGDALLIALGFMRGNFWITTVAMTIGKLARYAIIVATALGVFQYLH